MWGMATSPLPSPGSPHGQNWTWLPNPCLPGVPNRRGQNQKWLHHPCLRRSPLEGDKFRRVYITPVFLGADSLVRGRGGGGQKQARVGAWSKKDSQRAPGALILPLFLTGAGLSLTGEGLFLTGRGLFLTGRGLFLTGGGLFLTGGGLFLTAGGLFLTAEGLFLTAEGLFLTVAGLCESVRAGASVFLAGAGVFLTAAGLFLSGAAVLCRRLLCKNSSHKLGNRLTGCSWHPTLFLTPQSSRTPLDLRLILMASLMHRRFVLARVASAIVSACS